MNADDNRAGGRAAADGHNPLKCEVPGCPWNGSAGHNGRFSCIAHLGAETRDLPAITARTVELQWFAMFITDVQRMHTWPRKGDIAWISYADEFWKDNDLTMRPNMAERRQCVLYVNRMLAELRAMALGKERPQPHVPQGRWPEFNPHMVVAKTAEVAQ